MQESLKGHKDMKPTNIGRFIKLFWVEPKQGVNVYIDYRLITSVIEGRVSASGQLDHCTVAISKGFYECEGRAEEIVEFIETLYADRVGFLYSNTENVGQLLEAYHGCFSSDVD